MIRINKESYISKIGYVWTGISSLATFTLFASFYSPYWIIGSININNQTEETSFATFRRCNYPEYNSTTEMYYIRKECGRYISLESIPSKYWQLSTISISLSLFISFCIICFLIPFMFVPNIITRNGALICGLFQVLSGILAFSSCMVYPMGWDNTEIVEACGKKSNKFVLGTCKLGWAFFATIISSIVLLLCGLLSIKSVNEREFEYQGSNEPLTNAVNVHFTGSNASSSTRSSTTKRIEAARLGITKGRGNNDNKSFRMKMIGQQLKPSFIDV
uniref:Lipoma HMGIC fusion partner-like protein n=1 Tax=Parastrongyloides trichosuri TaxID=131310 RepID=A0A0N4Z5Y7_PARTI